MYAAGDYDLAGFAVGAAERGTLLPRDDIARRRRACSARLLRRAFQRLFAGAQGRGAIRARLGRACAVRAGADARRGAARRRRGIYVKSCLAAIRETGGVKALAHITGGGFPDNIPRVLPERARRRRSTLRACRCRRCSSWLAKTGGIAEAEMLRTFNCGIGMVAVVDADRGRRGRRRAAARGRDRRAARPSGRRADGAPRVRYTGRLDSRGDGPQARRAS